MVVGDCDRNCQGGPDWKRTKSPVNHILHLHREKLEWSKEISNVVGGQCANVRRRNA